MIMAQNKIKINKLFRSHNRATSSVCEQVKFCQWRSEGASSSITSQAPLVKRSQSSLLYTIYYYVFREWGAS